ncbi:MAG: DNA polymerase/3'-5' exonuclease PolX [Candidatus Omnitrophica bacterium]|nr:DNA polymerase/3'-5' exonuclease PolX [Candidatus Omnitrophota bacterium]
MDKHTVGAILTEIAELLQIKGDNPFKVRAYYNAARAIENLTEDLYLVVSAGRLDEIPGIGKALSEKIAYLVLNGSLPYYEELKESLPEGLPGLLKVPTLGPKKIRVLYEKIGITTLGELEYACHGNRLLALDGFGAKTQQNILNGIQYLRRYQDQHLFSVAFEEAEKILEGLGRNRRITTISLAGSIRRRKEIIRDIDIVAASAERDAAKVMEYFAAGSWVGEVVTHGTTKSSVTLLSGINCDLRVVTTQQFPYALHHFTGSKEHNTAMRGMAKKNDMKMNEYGLFKKGRPVLCKSEEDIFRRMGLVYIPPELRENDGEIEAAASGEIPALITEKDIAGILHVHSNYSDGTAGIEELARRAGEMGYAYLGICDHSQSARYAQGLTPERVEEQHREIDRINKKNRYPYILKGTEVDILPDGRLDYPKEVLRTFDFVIGAIHTRFGMKESEMTERIMKALRNPSLHILAHPTGRLLLSREPYAVDMHRVIETAAEYGKSIELNANPHRLDLDWRMCKHAREKGILLSINPDAHSVEGFRDMVYGVGIARKGWLEKRDVLNARPLEEVMGFFRKK